jgi:ABC-2 type transport system permease protein
MTKLLAIIKREYVQRVRARMFIVTTLLGPLMVALFTVVPQMILNNSGGTTRIGVVDQTGRLYDRIESSIVEEEQRSQSESMDSMPSGTPIQGNNAIDSARKSSRHALRLERIELSGSQAEIESILNQRIAQNQLDGYIILPADVLRTGQALFYTKNLSDLFTKEALEDRVSDAVIEQRMIDSNISPQVLKANSEPVTLRALKAGSEGKEDRGSEFVFVFIVGFLIYITILMYGQMVLGAIVEEKETRIAEMLFSSVRSSTLMMGKLIGVSLVALTQFAIWGLALGAFALYGVGMLAAQGVPVPLPHIRPVAAVYFVLFFLMGYFLYASIYTLLGSMVTTAQEGGQLAVPVVLILVIGFYFAFPIISNPDSPFAFWISLVPFFAPITMLVRIVTVTPPLWQIALSLVIGCAAIAFFLWLASRIYRVGMLMYGKRATIPEVVRWVRQA